MKKKSSFILLILGITGIFLYSGCSSTSNSIRYNTKEKTEQDRNSAIRFSSANENQKPAAMNNTIDTVSIDNIDTALSDSEDIPIDEKSIDISSLLQKYHSDDSNADISAGESTLKEKMLMEIIKYLNTPYKYGGDSKKGIDCSAFTQKIYENTFSIQLNRTAREQFHEGEPIHSIDDLKFGDLIFFNTRRWVRPGHVGIYIGDHLFAQSSRSHGVVVSSIDDSYYRRRFMGGRRIENLFSSSSIDNKQ